MTSSKAILAYNKKINTSFQKVFPGLSLKISVKDEGKGIDIVKAFKTNHSLDVERDGINRKQTFAQHGHGVIRQAFFNFLAFLKNESSESRKEYLLLFEEPELFLHPKSTRLLREELYSLAENSPFQIFCCTHCPQMIDISKPHCSLVRVSKVEDEKTVTHQVGHDIFQSDANKEFVQMVNRFDPNICEAFYSSNVCIVEGDTEAVYFREYLRDLHPEKDIFILNSGSKNNIPFFQRVLSHFAIPHTVFHDSDTRYVYISKKREKTKVGKDGEPIKNSAWSLNESIWNEILEAKQKGVEAHRIVFVFDFESANEYVYKSSDGKPLSAFKFALSQKGNSDLPAHKFLEQMISNNYEQEWSKEEVDAIEEPST